MADRLRKEGINVVNDKIQRFREVFWDPASELSVDKPKRRKKRPKNG
jgi:methylated-DNA-protein-cysteine methyltransferase related protein